MIVHGRLVSIGKLSIRSHGHLDSSSLTCPVLQRDYGDTMPATGATNDTARSEYWPMNDFPVGLLRRRCVHLLVTLFLLLSLCPSSGEASDLADLEELIDESRLTFARFVGNPNMAWFRNRARNARAVFIAPQVSRAGYILGASWGTGVLLVRNSETGRWSQPVFYRITGLSFGLQIGALHSEIVALATNDRTAEEMVDGAFNLGVGGAFGFGKYGGGLSGSLDVASGSDFVIVGSPTGFFAGLAAGATLALVRDAANELYYGHPVETEELRQNLVQQWYSDRLVKTITDLSASGKEAPP